MRKWEADGNMLVLDGAPAAYVAYYGLDVDGEAAFTAFIADACNAVEQRASYTYRCPVCLQPAIDARGLRGSDEPSEAGKAVLRDLEEAEN